MLIEVCIALQAGVVVRRSDVAPGMPTSMICAVMFVASRVKLSTIAYLRVLDLVYIPMVVITYKIWRASSRDRSLADC